MRKTTWIIFGVFSSTSDFDDHFEGPQKCNAVLNLIISEKKTTDVRDYISNMNNVQLF